MEGIAVASSSRAKPRAKVLREMTIKPRLGGGHIVTHHYEDYRHDSEPHEFTKNQGAKALKHIAQHAGLPHPAIGEEEDDEPTPVHRDSEANKRAL